MPETTVESLLSALQVAAEWYAQAVARESELHSRRGIMKSAAILRLIDDKTPNPETERPHTATSAEKVVESDATYAAFLKECRDSVVTRIHREAEYETAKLAAELAVRLASTTTAIGAS